MSETRLALVTFPSLRTARAARDRLVRAGFARNSIDIARHGDDFDVSIPTRAENHDRAERVLTGSPLVQDLRHAGTDAMTAFQGNRSLALGLAALAGFALFGLIRRR